VVKTRIISSLGYGCDEEASRIVKMLKFEVPKNRKMKVVFHKNITIHFRLPKKTEKQPTTIQYNITKQKPASQEPDKSSGSGYNYTIEF
jgi:protein TonB